MSVNGLRCIQNCICAESALADRLYFTERQIGDEDIKKAISLGIAKINIHTELCQATMEAINEHKDEPFLAVERAVRQAVKQRAMYKIKLFGDDGRADE